MQPKRFNCKPFRYECFDPECKDFHGSLENKDPSEDEIQDLQELAKGLRNRIMSKLDEKESSRNSWIHLHCSTLLIIMVLQTLSIDNV